MATIAVDFDGVIHKYSRGWQDGSIYDDPVDGAIEGIWDLQKTHAVYVHTTRSPDAVARWLASHGVACTTDLQELEEFWNNRKIVLVSQRKLPAIAYIDDRAFLFKSWDDVLANFGVTDG